MLKKLVCCGLLLVGSVALAEKKAFYVSAGLQYALVKTTITGSLGFNLPYTSGQSNMYGFSMEGGYKFFLGKREKRNGFRVYAFYDYGYDNPTFNGARYNNNVYGVGADYLFNFINTREIQTGFFMGIAFAGSSWSNSGASLVKSLTKYPGVSVNFSYFQIPLRFGVRANVTKHQGFEFGLKIPIVRNYYFRSVTPSGVSGVTFQRSLVLYANYVWNF
ncbi:outer membrane protein [Helicobacter bizzozeronii]|uniref:outer membrane protein n=1 Tax=Helicobacter bizzozeronii TaxID=56877 RepID=UPI001F460394|nr:outer membrane protein [Helicobacter bizzozeronii]